MCQTVGDTEEKGKKERKKGEAQLGRGLLLVRVCVCEEEGRWKRPERRFQKGVHGLLQMRELKTRTTH